MQVLEEARGVSRRGACHFMRAMAVAATIVSVASTATAQIAVSANGTPGYSIGVSVPPGIGGMVPNLALTYTGGSINGPVGYGWSLSGLSMITRCAPNRAADGVAGGVRYAPSDRLCLDGQRLIETDTNGVPVASTPAANGALLDASGHSDTGYTEYRTQTDLYARIRAYGMANGATANGPAYFKVWTKAGQIYEYGAGPSSNSSTNALISPYGSSVASAWAVARISDTVGNFIDFKYSYSNTAWGSGPSAGSPTVGHEWELAEIQYTGTQNANVSQAANNKIVFEYDSRPDTPYSAQDRSEAYHLGFKNVSVQRLKTIRSYVNWPSTSLGVVMPSGALAPVPATAVEVRALKLGYEVGPVTHRSRLISAQDCFGASESTCLPPTSITYAANPTNETYSPNAAFAASALATLPLANAAGSLGVLLGDFNGDGRTDIIRWSDTPSQNLLFTSNGDGTFTQGAAGVAGLTLFRSDGCYSSIAMDFNGDGLTDILRVEQGTATSASGVITTCPTPIVNILYLSKGDGTFTPITLPSNISLAQVVAQPKATPTCPSTQTIGVPTTPSVTQGAAAAGRAATPETTCTKVITIYSSNGGSNFHIMDVNGDGIPDIVTTITPAYQDQLTQPNPDSLCGICTHVYLGSTSGTFTELATTNIANHTVYGPPSGRYSPLRFHPYVVDMDGDGLSDLLVDSGIWRSLGNGNFQQLTTSLSGSCQYPMDFNGDGRVDCMNLRAPISSNWLGLSDGSGNFPSVANFNLAGAGVLTPTAIPTPVGSGVGVVFADLDGDGRTDIIRWMDDPTQNAVFLSNGDGSFRQSTAFNLNTAAYALHKSDLSVDFVTGDFTGNGTTEILRTVSSITAGSPATTNQLFVKNSTIPSEELKSVTPPSGLTSTVTLFSLPNSSSALGPRYTSARSLTNPVAYPKVDLTSPIRVVETVETATGVGTSTTKSEYAYGGFRAALDGRGPLGFLTVSEQHSAPDGSPLTTTTTYLQDGSYQGMAAVSQTTDAGLNVGAPLISRTTNSYCDSTSTAAPTVIPNGGAVVAPCATSSVVQRPYLYQSLEEGWDIDSGRTPLPTVRTSNVFDGFGNPTQITVATVGTAVGLSQSVTKTTNSTYLNTTSGDTWLLGRLQTSTQTNTVPNSLQSIATSAGSATYASATTGVAFNATWSAPSFANTMVGQSTTAVATLTNTSSGTLPITAPGASSVTGTDFAFVSTTCGSSLAVGGACSVTVSFSPTAATTRTGMLTVQTAVGAKSVGLSAQGLTPPALSLSGCTSTSPVTTPASASMTCTVGNTGQTAATGISYGSSLGGMTIGGGPANCGASTSNCGTVTIGSPTAVGNYVGTLSATPSVGNAGTAGFNLTVQSAVVITLTGCSSVTPATPPAVATMTCNVGNSGAAAASGLTYASSVGGMSISGPTSCAASSSCGTVRLTTPAAQGAYTGVLSVTPASGSGASAGFNLYETAAPVPFTSTSPTTSITATGRMGTWTFTNPNAFAVTVTTVGATVTPSYMASDVSIGGSCGSATVAAGGTCTVTLTTIADCTAYTATPTVTSAGGVATGTGVLSQPKTTNTRSCT